MALLLVAATALAYSNSYSIPFLFDDQNAVVENQSIRSLNPIGPALNGPRQSSTAGRPLVNLSFALNYAAGELAPAGYHLVNLAIHIAAGLLLFGIVRRTLRTMQAPTVTPPREAVAAKPRRGKGTAVAASPAVPAAAWPAWLAFFAALLWLLHPMQTEVVDYVTQRSESMMALAYLGTFYAFVRSLASTRAWAWQVAAVGACALGALCKESIVTAPLALWLFDTAFFSASPLEALKRRRWLYLGLIASWALLFVLNASGPRSNSAGFASGISPWLYLLNQGPILLHYFQRALVPLGLVFDYGVPRAVTVSEALPAVAVVAALAIAAVGSWRLDRRLGFLATFVFITLAPTSSVVPIATEVGAERRMYLALASLTIGLAVVAVRLLRRPAAAPAALTAVAVVFLALTVARNADYHDPIHLWQTVVDRYPHGRAHYGVAMALKAAGRTEDSRREMLLASRDFADADYALGFDLSNDGRHEEAIGYLQRYVADKPDDLNVVRAYTLIGRSLLALDRPAAAAVAFREALARRQNTSDALAGLGDSLVRLERFEEAIPTYEAYFGGVTTSAPAYFNYGLALAGRGRQREAAAAFQRASTLNPRDPAAQANLGGALAALGDRDGAIAAYQRVMVLDPDPQARAALQQIIADLQAAAR